MGRTFKVGDRVKLIDDRAIGINGSWIEKKIRGYTSKLGTIGKIVTVYADSYFVKVALDDSSEPTTFHIARLQLVHPNSIEETGSSKSRLQLILEEKANGNK